MAIWMPFEKHIGNINKYKQNYRDKSCPQIRENEGIVKGAENTKTYTHTYTPTYKHIHICQEHSCRIMQSFDENKKACDSNS